MRNEKKTKNDSRIHPENDDNNSMRQREKKQNNGLTPLVNQSELWYNQSITIEKKTRVPRTPVAFRREGFKRVNKDMQTTNINTLAKKGNDTMKNVLDILFGLVALLPAALLFIL